MWCLLPWDNWEVTDFTMISKVNTGCNYARNTPGWVVFLQSNAKAKRNAHSPGLTATRPCA